MATEITVTIEGAERLKRALSDPQLLAGPVRDFLMRSALTVEVEAKRRAPVDTGRLRSSITHNVRPTEAIVGSNVAYAPYVEFGTRPHWPPLAAMQPWARRHGFPAGRSGAFLVARAIAMRGTRAQPYLRPAFEASLAAIRGFLDRAAKEIEGGWAKHA